VSGFYYDHLVLSVFNLGSDILGVEGFGGFVVDLSGRFRVAR
jgi:hypothetical protein